MTLGFLIFNLFIGLIFFVNNKRTEAMFTVPAIAISLVIFLHFNFIKDFYIPAYLLFLFFIPYYKNLYSLIENILINE